VDFRGAAKECGGCHVDPHAAELGPRCESCHSAKSFHLDRFTHRRASDFFGGRHQAIGCEKCHAPASLAATRTSPAKVALGASRFTATPDACSACHRDVHLGQVAQDCRTCHSVGAIAFAADRFDHARTAYRLTGAHTSVACEKCHRRETGVFPSGAGSAVRFALTGARCATCHEDVHLGQVTDQCETCHTTRTFEVGKYAHKDKGTDFFAGPHLRTECVNCHKATAGRFPSGTGTAIRFTVSRQCVTCHDDVHAGAMGTACLDCHRLSAQTSPARPPIWIAFICHERTLT
jgi:hypothetical protein